MPRTALTTAFALAFSLLGTGQASALDEMKAAVPTLTVTGTGHLTLAPDMAYVTFGMQTVGKSLTEAQRRNNSVMQKVIDRLGDLAIDQTHIQTSSFTVSLRSQADTEEAELDLERKELEEDRAGERKELTTIYIRRGLDPSLANQVAQQLMAHDALGAHARDELGISETLSARPVQAALASAAAFAIGAVLPLLTVLWVPMTMLIPLVSGLSLVFLALLGGVAAYVGGANILSGAVRVTFWGALAMAATAGIGALVGTAV